MVKVHRRRRKPRYHQREPATRDPGQQRVVQRQERELESSLEDVLNRGLERIFFLLTFEY